MVGCRIHPLWPPHATCLFPRQKPLALELPESSTEAEEEPPPEVTENCLGPQELPVDWGNTAVIALCGAFVAFVAGLALAVGIGKGWPFLFFAHYLLFLLLIAWYASIYSARAEDAADGMLARDGQSAVARVTARYHSAHHDSETNSVLHQYAVSLAFEARQGQSVLLVEKEGFRTQGLWQRSAMPVKYLLFRNEETGTHGLRLAYAAAPGRRCGSQAWCCCGPFFVALSLWLHVVAIVQARRLAPAILGKGTYPEGASAVGRGFLCSCFFTCAAVFLWKMLVFNYVAWCAPAGKRFEYFGVLQRPSSVTRRREQTGV